ncbi:MAG TPA: hypothetical protein VGR35_03255 [Tepidisphaeraceae bacterium]|nr:hypothetical protein [Tepidisphaeraceae bacterium]
MPEKALRRWATQRLRRAHRADGGVDYVFLLSGSTCNNVPIEAVMTVRLDAAGRIEAASSRSARSDIGCDAMCAAERSGAKFLSDMGTCDEAVGLTLDEAAFRDWSEEPSGCFCTAGNRRHKWRNVFQAWHYAATHSDLSTQTTSTRG